MSDVEVADREDWVTPAGDSIRAFATFNKIARVIGKDDDLARERISLACVVPGFVVVRHSQRLVTLDQCGLDPDESVARVIEIHLDMEWLC